jgi:microcystin-dependent protein
MVGFTFAPRDWHLCDGTLLEIAQYEALFSVLGVAWGGDGQRTFALPDLQGRVPISAGQGSGLTARVVGETGGAETVTLAADETAAHTHLFRASLDPGPQINPVGNVPATPAQIQPYIDDVPSVLTSPNSILFDAGGGEPHDNVMPFQCINFVIAVEGLFPAGS